VASSARRSKLSTLSQVVGLVQEGASLALGGVVHTNRPAAFVRELVRQRRGPVELHSSPGSGWDVDLLIAVGLVTRTVLPMVTMAQHGLAPSFRAAAESGRIETAYLDAMSQIAGYLAGSYGHPFHLIASVEGTDIPADSSLFDVLTDSDGRRHRAVRAIVPDLCVVHVEEADEYGNVRHQRGRGADPLMVRAAKQTVVTAERIVSNAEIRRNPHLTTIPGNLVAHVVEAPMGAHPTATAEYNADEAHIAQYWQAAEALRRGDRDPFDAYLHSFVLGPRSDAAYLAAVGGEARLAELRREMADAFRSGE
jgi:glutaconate CoA-transferase subunit A